MWCCDEPIESLERECLRSLGHSASHAGFKGLGNLRGRQPLKVQSLSILYKSHRQATAINSHKNEPEVHILAAISLPNLVISKSNLLALGPPK